MEVCVPVIERTAMKSIRMSTVQQSAVVPIKTPPMPTPSESEKGSNAITDTEGKIRTAYTPPRIKSGPEANRIAVDKLRVVLGNVNHIGICRLNFDVRPLIRYGLLGSSLQIPGIFRFLAHELNGLHYIRLLVVVGVAQL